MVSGDTLLIGHDIRVSISVMSDRKILIIAGPNGAGKTTFAQEFLPGEAGCPHVVNADLIAAGLSTHPGLRRQCKRDDNTGQTGVLKT